MSETSIVRSRIDENITAEKPFPFDVRAPNAPTAKTLAASERGEDVVERKDKADLFQKLTGC